MSSSSHPHLRAILYALTGFTLWVLSDTCVKLAMALTPEREIMVFSSVGGMAILLGFLLLRGEGRRLRPRKKGALLILGLLQLVNMSCWLAALSRLPLANVYAVAFLAPIMIAMLAAVFLGERFGWKHGLAIVAGFAGALIAVNPAHLRHDPALQISYGLVVASMVCFSTQMILLRILGPRENRECAAFWPRAIVLVGVVIACVYLGVRPMPPLAVLFSVLSGGLGTFGWLCMAQAYKLAPAATVAPFHYSEIVTGALIGYAIWHDVPSAHLLLGVAVIIVSGLYIVTHARQPARILKEETHV